MKALVTGATGFLGRHLVHGLLQRGWQVRVLSRSTDCSAGKASAVEIFQGDLARPLSLQGLVRDIDVVFHLAAQLGDWGVPAETYAAVNVAGTRLLLELSRAEMVRRFVFVSTPGVQGKGHRQATEAMAYNPPYHYEKTKCAAEKIVLHFDQKDDLPTTIIRPDFVYGPGDFRRIPLYRAIKKGRFIPVGNGRSVLHPTYVVDAINGILLAAIHPQGRREIFNIAGPQLVSVAQYLRILADGMGKKLPPVHIPKTTAWLAAILCEGLALITKRPPFISRSKVDFLTRDHGSDISKARQRLNYQPRYGFTEGFGLTLAWLNSHHLL